MNKENRMNSKWKRGVAIALLVCVGAVTLGACSSGNVGPSAVVQSTASDQNDQ